MVFDEKFWLAASFIAFALIIIKFAFPLLAKLINNSIGNITAELNEAKRIKSLAEEMLKKAEALYKESVEYTDRLVKETEIESAKIISDTQESAKKEVEKRTNLTLARIKSEENAAINMIKKHIIDTTISKLEQDFTKELQKEEKNKIFDKAATNLSSNLVQ